MKNNEMLPQENVEISEEAIIALIDSDELEMPSWDQSCYVQ
ncbi:MAG: hypothetical protein FD189_2340 [Elusimicrobia bacterium]|nr:MAG: hypothetical protein FD154_2334 [Elusimicrobiota bacterium]KAF0153702.1 MAG: hypothetical protein FD189_2340 [Elusimicrobiota bacterium]